MLTHQYEKVLEGHRLPFIHIYTFIRDLLEMLRTINCYKCCFGHGFGV